MPIFLYKWSNGGLSMVLADNAEQAVLRLEEKQDDAGEGEEIERVLPEKLRESPRFQAHFELVNAAEEIEDIFRPEDLLRLDGNGFGADVDCHLEELYPRLWEVARRETSLVEAISLLGSGMPMSEIYAMYDEALGAEKTNSPLPEQGKRPTALPLTMRALAIFNSRRDLFERKFGREFGAGDLIFFDVDKPTPQRNKNAEPAGLWQELIAGMEEADISEAVRYATKKTGRVQIETHDRDLVPAESVAEWDAAIAEFEQQRVNEQTSPKSSREAEVSAQFYELLDQAQAAGVDPATIYASRKTGRMVTKQNMKYLTKEEMNEWNAAINEYHQRIKAGIQ